MTASKNLNDLLTLSRDISWKNFGKKVTFYAPSLVDYQISNFQFRPTDFPAISITGANCAINCKHCQGKVLETMIHAASADELARISRDLKAQGCVGYMITGGCTPFGSVPIEKFIDVIRQVKKELGLKIVMHIGLVDRHMANMLKEAGVDAVLTDIFGSSKIPREIFNVNLDVEDYEESLKNLLDTGINVVPHLTVGLYYGKLEGEYEALEMLSKYDSESLVIGALMPLPETPLEKVKPPSPRTIVKVLVQARFLMPKAFIVLGCTRPSGKHRVETDILALRSGVNAIAFPMEESVRFAESIGLSFSFSPTCCALAHS